MLPSAQTPACRTYLNLTETTCTACVCSAAAPSKSVLSSPISLSTVLEWCMGGGGGGGGGGGRRSRKSWAPPAFLEGEGGQDRARGRHLTAANTLSAFGRFNQCVCVCVGGGGGVLSAFGR